MAALWLERRQAAPKRDLDARPKFRVVTPPPEPVVVSELAGEGPATAEPEVHALCVPRGLPRSSSKASRASREALGASRKNSISSLRSRGSAQVLSRQASRQGSGQGSRPGSRQVSRQVSSQRTSKSSEADDDEGQPPEEAPEPCDAEAVCCVLMDHLMRMRGLRFASVIGLPDALDTVEHIMQTFMLTDFGGWKMGDYRGLRDVLRREQLRSEFDEGLLAELAAGHLGDVPHVARPGAWRELAIQVCTCKKEVREFKAHLRLWVISNKLMQRSVYVAPEQNFEHKRNHLHFWMAYHGCLPFDTVEFQERPDSKKRMSKSASSPGIPRSPQAASQPRSPLGKLPPLGEGRARYLKECGAKSILPTPLSFVVGNSAKFDASGKNLTDRELLAMSEMLREKISIESVDLSSNMLLTDKALAPFLERLQDAPASVTLRRLNLSNCTRAGHAAIENMIGVVKYSEGLRQLDLSHMAISTKFHLRLCQSIASQAYLADVNLAGIGFTESPHISQCLDLLVNVDSRIKKLDLSWNLFGAYAFSRLGECLAQNEYLCTLRLNNCSAGSEEPPVSFFADHLAKNSSLTHLELSLNRIDFRAALVIEDGLQMNKKLRRICLSENPLGVLGIRSTLRLLAGTQSGIKRVEAHRCLAGYERHMADAQVFCSTRPGGRYCLNLEKPYDRALLRMLYKTGERFSVSPEVMFEEIEYSKREAREVREVGEEGEEEEVDEEPFVEPPFVEAPYTHAKKDKAGMWPVLTEGILKFRFNTAPAMAAVMKQAATTPADGDFSGVTQRFLKAARVEPGLTQAVQLFAFWHELAARPPEQRVFLLALSQDFSLSASCIEYLCRTSPEVAELTISLLLPCLPGDTASRYISLMLFQTAGKYLRTLPGMTPLLNLCENNPTGRYTLDLDKSCEHAVALRLLLLDRWEAVLDKQRKRPDSSLRGNGSRMRNELFQGEDLRLHADSVAEWILPGKGSFECDYVSRQRPPPGAQALSNEGIMRLLASLYHSKCDVATKICVLRSVSSSLFISCAQMRKILYHFETQDRPEVFITLFMRIVDIQNDKLWRAQLDSEEAKDIMHRVGQVAVFPFVQPENAMFELDLEFHDQRLCLSMLRGLDAKEKSGQNLNSCSLRYPNGSKEDLGSGVPANWEDIENVPEKGLFQGAYRCAPEDRDFKARKDLSRTIGSFKVEVKEKAVIWWTGLQEAPPDVLELIEFLLGKYPNLDDAYAALDEAGEGQLKLKGFIKSLDAAGFHRFRNEDRAEDEPDDELPRIKKVFKYLDAGGEGFLTVDAWRSLTPFWKECELSVREFVEFLECTIGGYLEDAWEQLDFEAADEMTADAFLEACRLIGYFGPARIAAARLQGLEGSPITRERFVEVLQKYKTEAPAFKELMAKYNMEALS